MAVAHQQQASGLGQGQVGRRAFASRRKAEDDLLPGADGYDGPGPAGGTAGLRVTDDVCELARQGGVRRIQDHQPIRSRRHIKVKMDQFILPGVVETVLDRKRLHNLGGALVYGESKCRRHTES
ncbi:MAG: hypothetical protein BWZ02_02967 [Lentisphaerae bacterium ADurb.BinA184]|nr:MAG: hypothetical protein BWZ02_02967 [Lentisphaerae bacterium ADurb.BinA184]